MLDFGRPVLLTDVIVPMCGDLASLSIDVWIDSEETDGHRLVVSSDIGVCSLVMNDIMPPPVCRFLKVNYSVGFYLLRRFVVSRFCLFVCYCISGMTQKIMSSVR